MTGKEAHCVAPERTGSRPLVVLGCRVVRSSEGRLVGALGRRVAIVRDPLREGVGWVVVSGGRMWDGEIEADAMADELVLAGVPRGAIVRERCSLTTRDNARFSAALLGRLGVDRVTVVTCDWHLPRAAQFFRAEGLAVEGVAAVAPRAPSVKRWVRGGHEWVSSHVDAARRALL